MKTKDKKKNQNCWKIYIRWYYSICLVALQMILPFLDSWGKLDKILQYLHWAGNLAILKKKRYRRIRLHFQQKADWYNLARNGRCWIHQGQQEWGGKRNWEYRWWKTGDYEQQQITKKLLMRRIWKKQKHCLYLA